MFQMVTINKNNECLLKNLFDSRTGVARVYTNRGNQERIDKQKHSSVYRVAPTTKKEHILMKV